MSGKGQNLLLNLPEVLRLSKLEDVRQAPKILKCAMPFLKGRSFQIKVENGLSK